jgi:quinol monooxygenase YgiN
MDDGPVELTIVTLAFDAADPARLSGVLARYVVMSRQHPGCRNIDLCTSLTRPGRFVVIEKWENPEAQQQHFDSPAMVDFAQACDGLLLHAPDIDLLEGVSAHDLL